MGKSSSERRKTKQKERAKDMVISYIYSCIKSLKSKTETIDFLANTYNIDPPKTAQVWEKMEEENPEFFELHSTMILVNEQILKLYTMDLLNKRINKQLPVYTVVGDINISKIERNVYNKVLRNIERCIHCVLTKDETIKFLAFHCNIDEASTRAGWKKLKQENKQMFDNYYSKLELKNRATCDADAAAQRLQACRLIDSAESTNL